MKRFYVTLFALVLAATSVPVFAQSAADTATNKVVALKARKFYIGSSLDGAIFSVATQGSGNGLSTLRFSWVVNTGITFNYDFSKHFGLYTGLDIKNIGFIEQVGLYTIKHRTYNVGIPLGIKVGNMKHMYLLAGGGVDAPINYREKTFISRGHKAKFNEWFSDRTPAFMPYAFVGVARKGISLKVQYYFNNYMNPDFTTTVGGVAVKPYAGYNIHPVLLSLGFAMPYSKGPMYKDHMRHMYHHHAKDEKKNDQVGNHVL